MYTILVLIYFIFKLFYKSHTKFKLFSPKRYFRYIKLILKFNVIITIIISSFISNIIILNLNSKYDNLYSNLKNNIQIEAIVVSNKTEKEYADVYKIKVNNVNANTKYKNTYLYLKVNKKLNTKIEYGDKIIITGKFQEPTGQRNYKGFNYKEYLKTLKIYGTVKASKIEIVEKDCANIILSYSNKAFLQIKQNIEKVFPEKECNLFLGIMLGYTDNIEEDIVQSFQDSNIAHILAVSGMHITYIIIGLMFVLKNRIGKRKTRYIIIIALIIFMCITGFAPSIVRATIMGIILVGADLLYRKNDIWTSIAISLLILLIYNPFLLTSVSVLLSYGGTIGIIVFNKNIYYLFEKLKKPKKRYVRKKNKLITYIVNILKDAVVITISAQIAIIPIMIVCFNTSGIAFLITNVAISFIIGPITFLGFIAIIISFISLTLLKFISYILNPLFNLLIIISNIGNSVPFSKIYVATPTTIEIILYYFIIIILNYICTVYAKKHPTSLDVRVKNIIGVCKYKYRQNKKKFISIILILIICMQIIQVVPQDLKIYFIDVGQGDSTLVITPNRKSILIDGGGSLDNSYDVGKNTLLPYLLDRKITKIDYMFVSHFDSDHIGGLLTILEEIPVDKVFIAKQIEDSQNLQEFMKITKEKQIAVNTVKAGDKITFEKHIYMDVLFPTNEQITENALNNNAIVCKLIYKNFSMLFTGDIEKTAEAAIVKLYAKTDKLKSTVLKVAHHGSKTSTNDEILKLISPKIAVIRSRRK